MPLFPWITFPIQTCVKIYNIRIIESKRTDSRESDNLDNLTTICLLLPLSLFKVFIEFYYDKYMCI